MAEISYRPNVPWLDGRYEIEVADDPIRLLTFRSTLWGARRAARRLERRAAKHRRRMQSLKAVNR